MSKDEGVEGEDRRDQSLNRKIMFVLGLPGLHMAYYCTVFNPLALPLLEIAYGLDQHQEVLAISGNFPFIFAMGGTLGVALLGFIADRFGRIKLLLYIEICCSALCLLYSVKNLFILQVTRFLSGAIGGINNPLSGIILVELLPKNLSEKGNMMIFVSNAVSVMVSFCLPLIFSRQELALYWRFILIWPLPFHLLRAAMIYCYLGGHETPTHLATKTEQPEAAFLKVKSEAEYIYQPGPELDSYVSTLVETKRRTQEKQDELAVLKDLFLGTSKRKQWSGIFVNVIQSMTGGALLSYYSTQLFDSISGNGGIMTLIFGCFNITGGLLGVHVIDKFARVDILVYGCYIQAISLALLIGFVVNAGLYMLAPVFLISFVIVNAISLGATMNLYVNEILPPIGISISISASWISSGLIGKFTPYGLEYMGDTLMLLSYSGLAMAIGKIIGTLCYDPRETQVDYPTKELELSLIKTTDHHSEKA